MSFIHKKSDTTQKINIYSIYTKCGANIYDSNISLQETNSVNIDVTYKGKSFTYVTYRRIKIK